MSRSLSDAEELLLQEFASRSPAPATWLIEQARQAEVVSSCSCGCGSIAFVYADHATPNEPAALFPVEGELLDDGGIPIGGLILFVRGERPVELEVYAFGDEPLQLPQPMRVRWSRDVS